MLNSVAAGRRLAQRTAILQMALTLATTLACSWLGREAALGALAGGIAFTVGTLVAAWSAFRGGVTGAGLALGNLLVGTALKWIVVVVGLYLALAAWRLPALPVLAGAAMAAAGFLAAARGVADGQ